jgi:hypothetical protein
MDATETDYSALGEVKQNDGLFPLVPIAYAANYQKLMNHFRSVCKQNIISELAYNLTSDILLINPSHYSVWFHCTHTGNSDLTAYRHLD